MRPPATSTQRNGSSCPRFWTTSPYPGGNFGDEAAEPIARYVGGVDRFGEAMPAIAGLGSSMGIYLGKYQCRVTIWGGGTKAPQRLSNKNCKPDVRAVRGPLTERALLGPSPAHNAVRGGSVPFGDPALLLPLVYPRCSRTCKPTRQACLIPHFNDADHLRTAIDKGLAEQAAC